MHRERHDARARGRHESLRDLEQPPAAPAQLLCLAPPELVVEALRDVARQLYVLPLVLACGVCVKITTLPYCTISGHGSGFDPQY